jgi:hypothetical protein
MAPGFVRWHLIFVGHQYGTCFVSPFWRLEFWAGFWIFFGKIYEPLCKPTHNVWFNNKKLSTPFVYVGPRDSYRKQRRNSTHYPIILITQVQSDFCEVQIESENPSGRAV